MKKDHELSTKMIRMLAFFGAWPVIAPFDQYELSKMHRRGLVTFTNAYATSGKIHGWVVWQITPAGRRLRKKLRSGQ